MTQQQPQDPSTDRISQGDLRVYFAAERTMLAWVRTSVALMGFGFIVARFGLFLNELAILHVADVQPRTPTLSAWLGVSMIVLGVIVNITSAVRFRAFAVRFRRGEVPYPPSMWVELILAGLLAVLGLVLAAYIATVP